MTTFTNIILASSIIHTIVVVGRSASCFLSPSHPVTIACTDFPFLPASSLHIALDIEHLGPYLGTLPSWLRRNASDLRSRRPSQR